MSHITISVNTQQQDNLLDALREDYPRTIQGIAQQLNIPQASVRRTIGELKRFGHGIRCRRVPQEDQCVWAPSKYQYTLGRHGF